CGLTGKGMSARQRTASISPAAKIGTAPKRMSPPRSALTYQMSGVCQRGDVLLGRFLVRGRAELEARKTLKPEAWGERHRVSLGAITSKRFGAGEDVARQVDELIADDYRNNL